jgi:hypothetical protein
MVDDPKRGLLVTERHNTAPVFIFRVIDDRFLYCKIGESWEGAYLYPTVVFVPCFKIKK